MKNDRVTKIVITDGELKEFLIDVELVGRIRYDGSFVIFGCPPDHEKSFYKGLYEYDLVTSIMGFESPEDVEDYWLDPGDFMFLTVESGDYEEVIE